MGKYLDKIRQHECANDRDNQDTAQYGDIDSIVIEPTGPHAKQIYWERADMSIVGPCTPEFLARVRKGKSDSFWVVAMYEGQPVWINSIQLRSRRQLEQQVKPKIVELIREP